MTTIQWNRRHTTLQWKDRTTNGTKKKNINCTHDIKDIHIYLERFEQNEKLYIHVYYILFHAFISACIKRAKARCMIINANGIMSWGIPARRTFGDLK